MNKRKAKIVISQHQGAPSLSISTRTFTNGATWSRTSSASEGIQTHSNAKRQDSSFEAMI